MNMNRSWMPILAAAALASAAVSASQAANWQIGPFVRPNGAAPVITPNKDSVFRNPVDGKMVHWEALHTFNPAAIVRNGKIYVIYRAEDDTGEMAIGGHTSRLGLAESDDGIHFTRRPEPVLYPDNDSQREREWPGGCEDPRIVESDDGTYVLTYTQWNRQSTDAAIATSKDLVHWVKHGPIFGTEGKDAARSYKSAGIVTQVVGDRLIAAKIGGKYWMYWGEGSIRLATSDDLIKWKPVEHPQREPVVALAKRAGRFDSSFPETGPPPVLTPNGIVVTPRTSTNASLATGPCGAARTPRTAATRRSGPTPTPWVRRCSPPMLPPSSSIAPLSPCSNPSCRLKRPANTPPEQLSARAWSGSTISGFCITAAPIPWWESPSQARIPISESGGLPQ